MNYQPNPGAGQLPFAPPFVIPINVSHQFQQFAPMVTGFAMFEVLQTAASTPLRQVYAKHVQSNNWQNEIMQELVNATGQLAELMMATNQQIRDPQQAIQTAAQNALAMLIAVFVQRNQAQLGQYVQTQQQMEQINNLLNQFQQLDRQISQFYASLNNPATRGYGQPVNPGGYSVSPNFGAPNNGYLAPSYNQPLYGQGGGGLHNPLAPATTQPQPNRNDPFGTYAMPSTLGNPITTTSRAGNNPMLGLHGLERKPDATPEETRPMLTERDLQPLRPGAATAPAVYEAARVVREVEHVRAVDVTQPLKAGETTNWHTIGGREFPKVGNPERPWDAVLKEDGVEMRYYQTSGWEPTFSAEHPYRLAFNPDTHIKMHIRFLDGTIVDQLVKHTGESMRYLDHVIDPEEASKQEKSDQRHEVSAVDISVIQRLRPVPEAPLSSLGPLHADAKSEEAKETIDGDVKPVVLDTAIVVSDLALAANKIRLMMNKHQIEDDQPLECYIDLVAGLVVERGDGVLLEAALQHSDNLAELALSLDAITDPALLEQVDDRLTDLVNRTLNRNYGLVGWNMDAFSEDHKDLMGALKDKFDPTFAREFEQRLIKLARATLMPSKQPAILEFARSQLGISEDDLAASTEAGEEMVIVAFVDRVSVTHLPWSLEEMRVRLDPYPYTNAVQESALPELHKALKAILARTTDEPQPYSNRYLKLENGDQLEIFEGFLSKGSILLGYVESDEVE